jgi:hypothetical protein
MKLLVVGLLSFVSLSSFANDRVLQRTAKVVAAYTPISADAILANETNLNRVVADNFVAGEFFGNLNNDLKKEFGECANVAIWASENITLGQLSEAVAEQCSL